MKQRKSMSANKRWFMSWYFCFGILLLAFGIWRFCFFTKEPSVMVFQGLDALLSIIVSIFLFAKAWAADYELSSINVRHRYSSAKEYEEVKRKLILRLQSEEDVELLAGDILEVIVVASKKPDPYKLQSASLELDRLASFNVTQ